MQFTGSVLAQGLRAEDAAAEFMRLNPDVEIDEGRFVDPADAEAFDLFVDQAVRGGR